MTLKERFLDKVYYSIDGCWYWTASGYTNGYGQMNIDGKNWSAHRLSFTLHHGKIPSRKLVCHSCDNRLCVNPDHLFLGTHKDNTHDMIVKGRKPRFVGEAASSSKLKDVDIPIIRSLRQSGMTLAAIAERFDVRWQSIQCVVIGKSWKHI